MYSNLDKRADKRASILLEAWRTGERASGASVLQSTRTWCVKATKRMASGEEPLCSCII